MSLVRLGRLGSELASPAAVLLTPLTAMITTGGFGGSVANTLIGRTPVLCLSNV